MGPHTLIGKLALGVIVSLLLTVEIGYAQSAGPSANCATSAVTKQVRAEGVTEPVGNIILQCSSSTPGATINGNYTVYLPVDVTNRVNANNLTTDAMLSVDYGLGYVAVPGVFGQVNGHSITFNGVSLTVPANGKFGIQIANVRANVSELSGPAGQSLMATLSTPLSVDQGQVLVANAATSLFATLASSGINCIASPQPATLDMPGFFAAHTAFFTTRVTEGFGSAFAARGPDEDSGLRVIVHYSGFPANAQLYLPNLVAGYDAQVPTAGGDLGLAQAAGQYVPGSGTLLLGLVTGADTSGAGGTAVATPTGTAAVALNSVSQVALTGGAGYAVYEVLDGNPAAIESAQFPTFIVLTQISGPATAGASLTLAPVSAVPTATATDPVPRFVAVAPSSDCTIVGDCQAGYFPKLSVLNNGALQFTANVGDNLASSTDYLFVRNSGGGVMNWSITATYQNGSGWLQFDTSSGQNGGNVEVFAQPKTLAAGVYQGNIVVDAGPMAGTVTIPATLTVQAPAGSPASQITITSVLNPATMTATPLVAGSLATVVGKGLSGKKVAVTWNGQASNLLYSGDTQIDLQLPAAIGAADAANMVVTVDGASSAPQTVLIAPTWPAIFAHAVRNQDFSENTATHAAAAGSTLQIFLTGLPPGALVVGQIQNRSGLVPAYAGPAPGTPGVQQVNLTVPADLSAQTTTLSICAVANGLTACTQAYPVSIK